MNKLRLICAALLILSMVGLSIISLTEGNWRTFVLGVLYAIANVIIFII